MGSVLIAFELMLFKHRHEPPLAPRGMWPEPPETFSRQGRLWAEPMGYGRLEGSPGFFAARHPENKRRTGLYRHSRWVKPE